MRSIDLNCDVGEGIGLESALLPWVTSANVACGAHAGDDGTMAATLRLAEENGVVAGAHPGFADRENFGRLELDLPPAELAASLREQLDRLRSHGEFHYVKPHGALYNLAAQDHRTARLVVDVVRAYDPRLGLLALAGSELEQAGREAGLPVCAEAFADRAYDDAGHLVSRREPGAVLTSAEAAVDQVLGMVLQGRVKSSAGNWIELRPDSICLHGDNPQAVAFARELRAALAAAGVEVKSCWGAL
jgi:UPF0271 protein